MKTVVRAICSCYSVLLILYPRRLRDSYGTEMVEVFRQQLLDSFETAGMPGALRTTSSVMGELVTIGIPSSLRSEVLVVFALAVSISFGNGIGDMPMTTDAQAAFQRQIEETPGSEYLFPSPKRTATKPYITDLRKAWAVTLKKAGLPYFTLYELRHRADSPIMPNVSNWILLRAVWRGFPCRADRLKSA